MATHASMLAWRVPWTEEPGGLQSLGLQESDTLVTQLLLQSALLHDQHSKLLHVFKYCTQ